MTIEIGKGEKNMKENQEKPNNNLKPQGEVSAPHSAGKRSTKESAQRREGERKKTGADRLSNAAGQRK
jgi:hypothetical protein